MWHYYKESVVTRLEGWVSIYVYILFFFITVLLVLEIKVSYVLAKGQIAILTFIKLCHFNGIFLFLIFFFFFFLISKSRKLSLSGIGRDKAGFFWRKAQLHGVNPKTGPPQSDFQRLWSLLWEFHGLEQNWKKSEKNYSSYEKVWCSRYSTWAFLLPPITACFTWGRGRILQNSRGATGFLLTLKISTGKKGNF